MSGRHFLQVPGPTNVPERILRAMDRAVPDHRGRDLPELTKEVLTGLKRVFQTETAEVVVYPGSGTGAWEASLVNVLNPGDHVLAFNIGQFSHMYADCARSLGLLVDEVDMPWTGGASPEIVYERLSHDSERLFKAVLVVHNETSTGATSDIAAIRGAIDAARHEVLLLVDTISGLASMDFRFDEWGVDVAVAGSQKGLMMPPGLGMLCVSPRALTRGETATLPRYYFDWRPMLEQNRGGYFPYTPATLRVCESTGGKGTDRAGGERRRGVD